MATPETEFITKEAIATLTGASAAVLMLTTTIQRVTGKTHILIPFGVSVVVGLIVALSFQHPKTAAEWLAAVVNCCLLFCTVTGANELAAPREGQTRIANASNNSRKWFKSWFN